MKKLVVFAVSVLVMCLTVCAAEKTPLRIAVIPKGTTHVFWKSVNAGAVAAGKEFGAEIIWQGPAKEDDRRMQIEVVQNFISQKVDAIVLAPLDEKALKNPVESAVKAGIPVIIIDSGLDSEVQASFIATDNEEAGRLAAKRLLEIMDHKGKVILLRYAEGSASTMLREKGFLAGIKDQKAIELISSNQYAGATPGEAMKKAETLLIRFPEVEGVFCPNESSTFGMLQALKNKGLAGKVKFVGFDSSEPLVQALKDGQINGLTVQNPYKMGYLGVKTAVSVINKEAAEKRIDTGVMMVTADNLTTDEVKNLIAPKY